MASPSRSPWIIGLDLGTSTCKALAVDEHLRVLAQGSAGYPLLTPRPGWVEQSAQDVWKGVLAALRELGQSLPLGEAQALGFSGAMHSLLAIDAHGEPFAPAWTWADTRAAPQAALLRASTDAAGLYTRTGCPVQAPYWPARLSWLREEQPELVQPTKYFVELKDWVLFRLSGEWATDRSLASSTGLLDLRTLRWDEQALALAGIDAERLPPLVNPAEVVGRLTAQAARETGLPEGLPLVAGASDGALAMLGTGAADPGQGVITVGTSGAVRLGADRPLLDPQARTWCYVLGEGRWFAGGAINNGGLTAQWVRERLYGELPDAEAYNRLFAEAADVPPGSQGLLFLPYFTGERSPHWDAGARGVLLGMGLEHSRGAIARAALEGVAFCLADIWEVLDAWQPPPAKTALTGRITQWPLWCQIVSDVLGAPLRAQEGADASPLGAAMLALGALGLPLAPEEPQSGQAARALYRPAPVAHEFYAPRHRAFQQAYRTVRPLF